MKDYDVEQRFRAAFSNQPSNLHQKRFENLMKEKEKKMKLNFRPDVTLLATIKAPIVGDLMNCSLCTEMIQNLGARMLNHSFPRTFSETHICNACKIERTVSITETQLEKQND